MKVIVAGTRKGISYDSVVSALTFCWVNLGIKPTLIIQGGAPGVDAHARRWAQEFKIPIKEYPADWNKYGKAAGPIRNKEMVNEGDMLIAIWNGTSPGTKNIIKLAEDKGISVRIFKVDK